MQPILYPSQRKRRTLNFTSRLEKSPDPIRHFSRRHRFPPNLRFRPRWILALVALLLCGIQVLAQPAFPLHTAGRFIVDSQGTRIHIKSVNWYGAESSDFVVAGLQSASVASIVQQIKALGFNTVRLPWSNQMYETNPAVGAFALTANPSLQGKSSLAILDQVVSAHAFPDGFSFFMARAPKLCMYSPLPL